MMQATAAGRSRRLGWIDNLRVALTSLLIPHHAAITYGASGSWYVRVPGADDITVYALSTFAGVNQSWFMGAFFLIAALLMPGSVERKGAWRYLADRLLRLGVPLLVYGFLIGPTVVYLVQKPAEPLAGVLFQRWRMLDFDWGPMWFVAALLYFSIAYLIWRVFAGPPTRIGRPLPSDVRILRLAIAVGLASFVLRLGWPMGASVFGLQLGFFSSYVAMFIIGVLAWRHGWLEQLTSKRADRWLNVSGGALAALGVFALATGVDPSGFAGGLNLAGFFYAMWEPLMAVGIAMSAFVLFRDRLDGRSRFWRELGRAAYPAYIVHPAVLVPLSLAATGIAAPPIVKFVVIGALSVAASFAVGYVLRSIPGSRRIL